MRLHILVDAEQIGAEWAGATAGHGGDEDEGPAVTGRFTPKELVSAPQHRESVDGAAERVESLHRAAKEDPIGREVLRVAVVDDKHHGRLVFRAEPVDQSVGDVDTGLAVESRA